MQRIIGIIGWVGTGIVFLAAGARVLNWTGTFTIAPEQDRYVFYVALAGLALVVLYTLGQWREIVEYFRRRQARYGAVATVGVLAALAIAVALNYLGARQNKRWDLTASRQNSLSEQTIKVLQGLKAPAKFVVFDRPTEFARVRSRLDGYAYNSRQVSVEYIDPDTKPVVAREYDVQAYGTIVVDYMGRRERVTTINEQDLTNALIKALSTKERKLYFLGGHGEKEYDRVERDGYSAVSGSLRQDNYLVERLVLAQQKEVPSDATVVLIAGPTIDILPTEAEALERYLARAGKLMILLDPPIGPQAAQLSNLEAIIREWGITPGRNVVVDLSGATNEPSIAVAATYPDHPITSRFTTLTIYPLARAVEAALNGTNGRVAQSFVETSRQSWAESSLASLTSGVTLNEASGDEPGPISLAAAVSAPAPAEAPAGSQVAPAASDALKPETRVVVFGDSDFAANAYSGVPGNANLFTNAVNWLAQQENLIAIRPTAAEDRRVAMTPRQQTATMLGSIFVLPALIFAAGIFIWWRRR